MVAGSRGSGYTGMIEASQRMLRRKAAWAEEIAEELAGALRLEHKRSGHKPDDCQGCKALTAYTATMERRRT